MEKKTWATFQISQTVTPGRVLGEHYSCSYLSRLKATLHLRTHRARGLFSFGLFTRAGERPESASPGPGARPPSTPNGGTSASRSEARGHDASQRLGLRVAAPPRALPPRPASLPGPLALGPRRREGKGAPSRRPQRPPRPRGAPLAPRTYLQHPRPARAARSPTKAGRPSRPGRYRHGYRYLERPPKLSPVGGTRLPRGASRGRALAARGQSLRAATPHWGDRRAGCGGCQSAKRSASGHGARPNSAAAWAEPGAQAPAALTVASWAGLAVRRAAAARSAGNGERGECREQESAGSAGNAGGRRSTEDAGNGRAREAPGDRKSVV